MASELRGAVWKLAAGAQQRHRCEEMLAESSSVSVAAASDERSVLRLICTQRHLYTRRGLRGVRRERGGRSATPPHLL